MDTIQIKIDETEQLMVETKIAAEKQLAFLQGKIEAFKELLPDVLTEGTDEPDGEPA